MFRCHGATLTSPRSPLVAYRKIPIGFVLSGGIHMYVCIEGIIIVYKLYDDNLIIYVYMVYQICIHRIATNHRPTINQSVNQSAVVRSFVRLFVPSLTLSNLFNPCHSHSIS